MTQERTDTWTYALRSLVAIEVLAPHTSIHHVDKLGLWFVGPAWRWDIPVSRRIRSNSHSAGSCAPVGLPELWTRASD